MNRASRTVAALCSHTHTASTLGFCQKQVGAAQQLQQWRGIRVKVINGNLDQALGFMQRVMQSSGIERFIKNEQIHHIKNCEKRVLARKNLERKVKSQELARRLKTILLKKVRGL